MEVDSGRVHRGAVTLGRNSYKAIRRSDPVEDNFLLMYEDILSLIMLNEFMSPFQFLITFFKASSCYVSLVMFQTPSDGVEKKRAHAHAHTRTYPSMNTNPGIPCIG